MTEKLSKKQNFPNSVIFCDFAQNYKKWLVRLWYTHKPTKEQIDVWCVVELFPSEMGWHYSKCVKLFFIKLVCVFIVLVLSLKIMPLLEQFGRKISCGSAGVLLYNAWSCINTNYSQTPFENILLLSRDPCSKTTEPNWKYKKQWSSKSLNIRQSFTLEDINNRWNFQNFYR